MKKKSLLIVFLVPVICLFYTGKNRWKGEKGDSWKTTICSDGYGYYAYLPCLFIYHKFDYDKVLTEEKKAVPWLEMIQASDYYRSYDGKKCDKCFAGVSVLIAPFFLIAYFLSSILGFETTGYSIFFQGAVSMAALFYLFIGLFFLRKLLKEYYISDWIISFVLILVVFGSNLLYYVTIEPAMAHVYSFSMLAIFLFYSKKTLNNFRLKYLLLLTISISLSIIIRPTNILCAAFIPFLAGDAGTLKIFVKHLFLKKYLITWLPVAFAVIAIQFILWHIQTGHWVIWSYQGEGFNFKHFHFFDILFSFRNGWFIYTPLMLLSLGSMFRLFNQNKFAFSALLLFYALITYVFSSWWAWNYGGLGLRAFIDFYAAFALSLGLFLEGLKPLWLKSTILLICILFIPLNLVQTYQFRNGIMCGGDMDWEKYQAIFLKTSNRYKGIVSNPLMKDMDFPDSATFSNNFEHNTWGNNNTITNAYAHSGKFSAMVNEKMTYSPGLSIPCRTLPQKPHLYVYIDLWALMPSFDNDAQLVVNIGIADSQSYFYTSAPLKNFMDNAGIWQQEDIIYELPAFKNNGDRVSVYIYSHKGSTYIDDMQIKFGTEKTANLSATK